MEFFFFFLTFRCTAQHRRLFVPRPGIELLPLHWKCGALTTGPPEKSPKDNFFLIYFFCQSHFCQTPSSLNKWNHDSPVVYGKNLISLSTLFSPINNSPTLPIKKQVFIDSTAKHIPETPLFPSLLPLWYKPPWCLTGTTVTTWSTCCCPCSQKLCELLLSFWQRQGNDCPINLTVRTF